MRARNRHYIPPQRAAIDALKLDLDTYFSERPSLVDADFDHLRRVVASARNATDGEIDQALRELGYEVDA